MFFSKKTYTVTIKDKDNDITLQAKSGTNLYKLLLENNVINPTLCNGVGQCGKCKIKILGGVIPKPTYKENLNLAKINLDAGFRLACQQIIKKDIHIDTGEMSRPAVFFTKDQKKENIADNKTAPKEDTKENENILTEENKTVEEAQPLVIEKKENYSTFDIRKEDGPTDGILLIQQRSGIKYYCYSAGIDRIISEGVHSYHEKLRDIMDNDALPDFLDQALKIRGIERVLVLIQGDDHYGAETLMDMFRYVSFEIGMQQCEMIMPRGSTSYDITHFFRLLNADNNNQLIFSLDMLNRCHYATPNLFTDMQFPFLRNSNLLAVKPLGYNSIKSFNENLDPASIENKEKDVDGITLTALLQAVKYMLKHGIINNKYQLKSRLELSKSNVPLGLSVRVFGGDVPGGFYLYRDRFAEIILTQEELNEIFQIRSYIRSVIDYTRDCIGVVNGLIFYTTHPQDELVNLMADLEFIPKEYANKVIYRPGEATIQAVKLFKEKDVPTYLKTHFGNVRRIDLLDDSSFQKSASSNLLEI